MDSNATCHGAKTEAKIAIACREVILKITAEYIVRIKTRFQKYGCRNTEEKNLEDMNEFR